MPIKKLLLLSLLIGPIACSDKESSPDNIDGVNNEETAEGSQQGDCVDGQDNDNDGYIDCEDDGCADKPACEDTVVDEDQDGVEAQEDCAIASRKHPLF